MADAGRDEGGQAHSKRPVPEWQRQSVERSLAAARDRAHRRSDRFVTAATELMGEQGGMDFTVQDVVDRSQMSIRTFYNFFTSKDELLLAVLETSVAEMLVPMLRAEIDHYSDPLDRLYAYVDTLCTRLTSRAPATKALTAFHNRLAEARPDDVALAYRPQLELVVELVEAVAEADLLETTLDTRAAGQLLHQSVLGAAHAIVLQSGLVGISTEQLWEFCAAGIGIPQPTLADHTRRRRRRRRTNGSG